MRIRLQLLANQNWRSNGCYQSLACALGSGYENARMIYSNFLVRMRIRLQLLANQNWRSNGCYQSLACAPGSGCENETIVFVANAHAHVSQTVTAHAQIVKMDFPYGFSPISP